MAENTSECPMDEKILDFFNDISSIFDGYIELNKQLTFKFEALRGSAKCIITELAKKKSSLKNLEINNTIQRDDTQQKSIEDTSNQELAVNINDSLKESTEINTAINSNLILINDEAKEKLNSLMKEFPISKQSKKTDESKSIKECKVLVKKIELTSKTSITEPAPKCQLLEDDNWLEENDFDKIEKELLAITQKEFLTQSDTQTEEENIITTNDESNQISSTATTCAPSKSPSKSFKKSASKQTKNLLNDSTSDDEIYEDFESSNYNEGVYSTLLHNLSSHLPVDTDITYQESEDEHETDYDSFNEDDNNVSKVKVKKKKVHKDGETPHKSDKHNEDKISDLFGLSDSEDSRPYSEMAKNLTKEAKKELLNIRLSSDFSTNDFSMNEDSNESIRLTTTNSKKRPMCDISNSNSSINDDLKRPKISDEPLNEESQDIISLGEDSNPAPTKLRSRALIPSAQLKQETQEAVLAENERIARLKKKKQLRSELNKQSKSFDSLNSSIADNQPDFGEFYLDIDENTNKKLIKVDNQLTKVLKPHQFEGVQFMWDSCFENIEIAQTTRGGGCVLAHSMGLGKTLQIITLVHTLLAHQNITKVYRVLILVPVNVQQNWINEFNKWTRKSEYKIKVDSLNAKLCFEKRIDKIENWFERGGVLISGFYMFARIIKGIRNMNPQLQNKLERCLLKPGADLIIFDEGHVLKTEKTQLAKCVAEIQTLRRVVITGTPLQNNLVEYHCMVNFVKPNFLGTLDEFKNRFINPISNGQHRNSTDADVRYMKKRAHILHNHLEGCVQRKDCSIIKEMIPPKNEYGLLVRLTDCQVKLYTNYLERFYNSNENQSGFLFADFVAFLNISSHPHIFGTRFNQLKEKAKANNLVQTNSELNQNDDLESNLFMSQSKLINSLTKDDDNWWRDIIGEQSNKNIQLSGKFILLEKILIKCLNKGESLVVFSQCLRTLDLIEFMLNEGILKNPYENWIKDLNYFRIDGTINSEIRNVSIDKFNESNGKRGKLFIISTKAGGIGINLCGANRCIIFDVCWNPSHDLQSVFRIYRIGQKKECFIYRFIAQGTMEEKIYQRQVLKQAVAQRVLDEHQIDRHFDAHEKRDLYQFEPKIWNESETETPLLPKDLILADVLKEIRKWVVSYHEHDMLLQNRPDEELSEIDRKAAWQEYEAEKAKSVPQITNNSVIPPLPQAPQLEEGEIPPNVLMTMEANNQIINTKQILPVKSKLMLTLTKKEVVKKSITLPISIATTSQNVADHDIIDISEEVNLTSKKSSGYFPSQNARQSRKSILSANSIQTAIEDSTINDRPGVNGHSFQASIL